MSLKAEIITWAQALQAYDADDLPTALGQFELIADTSKIMFNIGLIHATLGEHEIAVDKFRAAVDLDQYLAIAYFQCGVSNFLLGRYDLALKDFEDALLYLRGNQAIDYEQIGLKFKLYSAEVLFNKGLSLIYMGLVDQGLADLQDARSEKATAEHAVIDEAIGDKGEGYTVFSIPIGVLYRPSESKLKNAKTKDYLGKAKLVSAADSSDAFTTFTGVTRLRQGVNPSGSTFADVGPLASGGGLNRSVTSPPAPRNIEGPNAAALARSKTTLNVPSDARERIAGGGGSPAAGRLSPPSSAGPALGRSATSGGTPSSVRGLNVRGANTNSPPPLGRSNSAADASPSRGQAASPPPAQTAPAGGKKPQSRLTEIYNDYLEGYDDPTSNEPVPPLPNDAANGRIAAWAEKNANPPPVSGNAGGGSGRRPSAPSTYAPSSYGGPRRRGTSRRTKSIAARSVYDDGENGDDFANSAEEEDYEFVRVRVKLHFQDDIRGMAVHPDTPFAEFRDMVSQKFDGARVDMKFKEDDGGKVSLRDESDWEMALETAREHAKGKSEGKLEIWCTEK